LCVYLVTLADGQQFKMRANLVQASASIYVNWHNDDDDDECWQCTPYQTATARHSELRAAELCASYLAAPDDCIEVLEVIEAPEVIPEP